VQADRPWRAGDRLIQPELARTLRVLAEGGQQAFYEGEFAEQMDRFFCDTGGLLRKRDLVAYRPLWQRTLSRRFGDVEVHVPPPESTGFSVLYGLELLARLGYDSMPFGGLAAARTMVSVLREMVARADELAAHQTPYEPGVEQAVARLLEDVELAKAAKRLGGDARGCGSCLGKHTTSLSACDSRGNLACLTQTLDHGFGSGVVIPGTGVLMNNGMAWLNTDPSTSRADLVAPHKRFFVPVVRLSRSALRVSRYLPSELRVATGSRRRHYKCMPASCSAAVHFELRSTGPGSPSELSCRNGATRKTSRSRAASSRKSTRICRDPIRPMATRTSAVFTLCSSLRTQAMWRSVIRERRANTLRLAEGGHHV